MDEQKHTGLGIASFIISILSGILMFITVMTAGIIELSNPGGIAEAESAMVIGVFLLLFFASSLVAFGLGIGGLFQKERKKIFAILGTVFSAVTVIGVIFLFIIGSVSG